MIRRGWRHADLSAMSVEEVGWWLREQLDYDRAVAEAIEKARSS